MRYVGWIIAFLLAVAGAAAYFLFYTPLKQGYDKQTEEVKMWMDRVAELENGGIIIYDSVPDTTADTSSNPPTQEFNYGILLATIPTDDLFNSAKSLDIATKGKAELEKILPALRSSEADIIIMVHDDNVRVESSLRDLYPTNWELTARRSAAIARYLLGRGIDSDRIIPAGVSAARPLTNNSTPESRAKNRRVEIYLRK